MGQKPVLPVNIPILTKIGSKMGGAPAPKWDPIGFDPTTMSREYSAKGGGPAFRHTPRVAKSDQRKRDPKRGEGVPFFREPTKQNFKGELGVSGGDA